MPNIADLKASFAKHSTTVGGQVDTLKNQLSIIERLSWLKACKVQITKKDAKVKPKKPLKDEVNSLFHSSHWYTAKVQHELACIITQKLKENHVAVNDLVVGSVKLQELFTPIAQLSSEAESKFGVTARTGLQGSDFCAILKYTVNADLRKKELLIHEIAIGLVLNTLRDYTPNFMYVYGGFLCSPMIGPDQPSSDPSYNRAFQPGRLCAANENKDSVHALMLSELVHNIDPEAKLHYVVDYLQNAKITEVEVTSILLQLIFSLTLAHRRFNFRHNDLHNRNIMVHEQNPKARGQKLTLQIPYFTTERENIKGKIVATLRTYTGATGYLTTFEHETFIVPQIIDYGFSYLEFDDMYIAGDELNLDKVNPTRFDFANSVGRMLAYTNAPSGKKISAMVPGPLIKVINATLKTITNASVREPLTRPNEPTANAKDTYYTFDELADNIYKQYIVQ